MKKFFKFLAFSVLGLVTLLVGIIVFGSMGGADNDETFIPFIEDAIPKLTTWDIQEYKLLMSKKGMEAATPAQWELYIDLYATLGSLQGIGEPRLKNWQVKSMIPAGVTTHAIYVVPLVFDTGEAGVELVLQHKEDKVEINSVSFLSDLLLKRDL